MSHKVSSHKMVSQARMQPIHRRARACGKVRFPNELEAMIALASATRPGRSNDQLRYKEETRYYKCPLCHGWHLTARPTWTRNTHAIRGTETKGNNH